MLKMFVTSASVLLIAGLLCFICTGAVHAERIVSDNTVYSQHDPRANIRLPGYVRYVGSDRFSLTKPHLSDFDACEMYVFADAGSSGSLRTVYWVQFEGYPPKYPYLHHTYDSPHHAKINGMDFYVDIEVSAGTAKPTPGSDGEHFYTLLAAHGYKRTPMMFVRLVHLLDAQKRKELMIIAGRNLPAGITAASIEKGGGAYAERPAIERQFVAWAIQSIAITTPPAP